MYYILKPLFKDETATIDRISHWKYSLTLAEKLPKNMPELIEYEIDTSLDYSYMPTTFLPDPVFSNEFIMALKNTGVDNIDTYNVKIINSDTGDLIEGYKAVNIIGKISCVDKDASTSRHIIEDQSSFDKLVIDTSKTNGSYLFRLAEWTQLILIHEHVVNNLSSKFASDIYFEPVDEI